MRVTIRAGFAASAGVALLLAGCSNDDPSPSPPAGAAERPNSPSSPANGAPQVPNSLNIKPLEANPCSAITDEQIASLGEPLQNAEREDTDCSWKLGTPQEFRGQFDAGLLPAGQGLNDTYKQHEQGQFPTFEPVTIAGYPAVINGKTRGECTLVAGLRNDRVYLVTAQAGIDTPMEGNECQAAQKVTEFAINNLKGAS